MIQGAQIVLDNTRALYHAALYGKLPGFREAGSTTNKGIYACSSTRRGEEARGPLPHYVRPLERA